MPDRAHPLVLVAFFASCAICTSPRESQVAIDGGGHAAPVSASAISLEGAIQACASPMPAASQQRLPTVIPITQGRASVPSAARTSVEYELPCHSLHYETKLHIIDRGVQGTIPTQVGLLTRLESLVLLDSALSVGQASEVALLPIFWVPVSDSVGGCVRSVWVRARVRTHVLPNKNPPTPKPTDSQTHRLPRIWCWVRTRAGGAEGAGGGVCG